MSLPVMSESELYCCLSISSEAAFYFPYFYIPDSNSASPIPSPHLHRLIFNVTESHNGIYLPYNIYLSMTSTARLISVGFPSVLLDHPGWTLGFLSQQLCILYSA